MAIECLKDSRSQLWRFSEFHALPPSNFGKPFHRRVSVR
jgi:hypothetical protein